jgi:hypothetical protein
MNTQTVIVAHQRLLAPLVDHLLLPQASTATKPADPWDFGPESFTFRATTISVVLKEILEQKGYPHGGIND